MRTWMAALVATLGLCSVAARADEPAKKLPAPAAPEKLPAPADKPVAASTCGGASCGTSCQSCCRCCGFSGKLLAWLTYRPGKSCSYLACSGPRPTPAYVYFMDYPCHEGSGSGCAKPACASCSSGGSCGTACAMPACTSTCSTESCGGIWSRLLFWR